MIYKFSYLSLFVSASSLLVGQINSNRIDSTDRSLPSPVEESIKNKVNDSSNVISSDTGAQRPLILTKSGLSLDFGYNTRVSYKQNPLGAPGILDQQADLVWENTFNSRAKLGVYDLDTFVLTPFLGGAWTMTDYTHQNADEAIPDLGVLNHNTTTAYLLFLLQHQSGWAFRAGVMYSNDRSAETDTEEYKEFYPSIGATKAHTINEYLLGVLDLSAGTHLGDVEDADGSTSSSHTADELDHIDATLRYSIIYNLDNFKITPSYSVSYRKYDNGFNFDRSDVLQSISLDVDYPITESFDLSIFSNYARRTSSGTDEAQDSYSTLYDFKKFDIGAGLGITASF